ncbi:MAG: hypothetical protein H0V40_05750, partial [Actinobacteria bacterium]|nr:hypothetical protein [Actinomycetota bacterium]
LLTAAFALVAARGLWLPAARPRLADGHSRTLLRVALLLGAVQVVNLASYRIELFMLRRFEGLAEIGVYSITMQAAESIWLIPAALATAVTAPAVHEVEEQAARLVVQAARRSLLLTAAVAAAVGVAAPFFIPLVLGEDFAGASLPLALLLPGVVAYAPVTVLVVYLSVRRGRPRLSLVVSLVGLAVTCTCAIPLIRAYGTGGAAVASSIGYAAGALLTWAFFVRLSGTGWLGRTRPAPL